MEFAGRIFSQELGFLGAGGRISVFPLGHHSYGLVCARLFRPQAALCLTHSWSCLSLKEGQPVRALWVYA